MQCGATAHAMRSHSAPPWLSASVAAGLRGYPASIATRRRAPPTTSPARGSTRITPHAMRSHSAPPWLNASVAAGLQGYPPSIATRRLAPPTTSPARGSTRITPHAMRGYRACNARPRASGLRGGMPEGLPASGLLTCPGATRSVGDHLSENHYLCTQKRTHPYNQGQAATGNAARREPKHRIKWTVKEHISDTP